MPFTKPSLSTLISRMQSDLSIQTGIALPFPRATLLSSLSHALAGSVYLLYGSIEYWVSQWFLDTAQGENLDRLGSFMGFKRRGMTHALGMIRIEGKPGIKIPKNSKLSRAQDGSTYETTHEAVISSLSFAHAKIQATEPGSAFNLPFDTRLTHISAIAGVSPEAFILNDGITGGFDLEDDSSFRDRILRRIRHPGQGGSTLDYEHWAQEIPGVGNLWLTAQPQSFSIFFSFLTTDPDYPIPSDDLAQQVQDHLDSKKPLGTAIVFEKLVPLLIPIQIQFLDALDESEKVQTQALLKKEFQLYFLKTIQKGESLSPLKIMDRIKKRVKHSRFKLLSPMHEVVPTQNQILSLKDLQCL